MLEMHGDVYVIGGEVICSACEDNVFGSDPQSAIYQLSCSSGLCNWTTLNQHLNVARAYPVAIPVQDNFCS